MESGLRLSNWPLSAASSGLVPRGAGFGGGSGCLDGGGSLCIVVMRGPIAECPRSEMCEPGSGLHLHPSGCLPRQGGDKYKMLMDACFSALGGLLTSCLSAWLYTPLQGLGGSSPEWKGNVACSVDESATFLFLGPPEP